MCLLNYNKKINKYKHITYAERTMIERWYNKEKLDLCQVFRHVFVDIFKFIPIFFTCQKFSRHKIKYYAAFMEAK